jgi:Ni,Fe-hydrogenase III large subunit
MKARKFPAISLSEIAEAGRNVAVARGCIRTIVDEQTWLRIAAVLGAGDLLMLGFWAEPQWVHLAVFKEDSGELLIASLACADGEFPSLARHHPAAIRLERTITDLFGLKARSAPDKRPWLDHGKWNVKYPLSEVPQSSDEPSNYEFLPAEGEDLHKIGVGPVHAGIIEPGHFRFVAAGETIVRLEERLGYTHKGIEKLMQGASLEACARLAGRVSGDSTVAYAIAFAAAVETALEMRVPHRSGWLRALMGEMERLANHLGDIGAVCNDAAFALMHAHTGVLREQVLRAADIAFGHRLMRDCVIPGGVTRDLTADGETAIWAAVREIGRRFPKLIELYDDTASLQDRTVGAGALSPDLARQFGAGGFVGRASGRVFDARLKPGYAPYGQLQFEVPVLDDGDVNARVWIRIREVQQSLSLIEQILGGMPPGSCFEELPRPNGDREALALVEGFRGDILVWVRLTADLTIERCHLRDPSWFQWPLLEAAIEGNIVADFPLCNKSFNCSYSGHDL